MIVEGSNLRYSPLEELAHEVASAQADYDQARQNRIDVVLAAHREGLNYHAIGRELGVSHVAARKLVLTHRRDA